MKRLLSLTILILIISFVNGCGENDDVIIEPVDVDVDVRVTQPIAKLIEMKPEPGSTVFRGDEITLKFTEVPEDLRLNATSKSYLQHNGDKIATLTIHDDYVIIIWKHGYLRVNYDIQILPF